MTKRRSRSSRTTARRSTLTTVGLIFALIGGIILIAVGALSIISLFVEAIAEVTADFYTVTSVFGTGDVYTVVYGLLAIIMGILVIWIWKEGRVRSHGDLLIYGIIFIVLGVVGGMPGGIIVFVGGVFLVIDYLV